MKTLFPSMDKEIADDRTASARERVQRARDHLKNRELSWLINSLLENGPLSEAELMIRAMNEEFDPEKALKAACDVLSDLFALWETRKLWRESLGIHPGSGQDSFLYGICGVHKKQL